MEGMMEKALETVEGVVKLLVGVVCTKIVELVEAMEDGVEVVDTTIRLVVGVLRVEVVELVEGTER